MKTVQFQYINQENFTNKILRLKKKCDKLPQCTAVFYITWVRDSEKLVANITDCIKLYFPEAIYYGNETAGNILKGKSVDGITVTCNIFEDAATKVKLLWIEEGTKYKSLEDLWDYCRGEKGLKGIELLSAKTTTFSLSLDKSLPEFADEVAIFGGVSIDCTNPSLEAGILTKEHGLRRKGMAAVLYYGENLNLFTTYILGWKGLGRLMQVTKTHDKVIDEIEGQPAFSIYEKYLGLRMDDNVNLIFPLLIEEDGIDFIRIPETFLPDKSVQMGIHIDEGIMARIAYGDKNTILNSLYDEMPRVDDFMPQAIKVYSCLARKLYWGNEEIYKETRPLQDIALTSGFYSGGEILRLGDKVRVLNSTLVIVGFREGEKNKRLVTKPLKRHRTDKSIVSWLTGFAEKIVEEQEEQQVKLKEQQIQLAAALKNAEIANNSKTSFLFNMSHDIRTPMNAIIGFATMAKKYSGDKERVDDYLNKIEVSGKHMLELINTVLEMSRIESGKIEFEETPVSIRDEFDPMVIILAEQAKEKGLIFNYSLTNVKHYHVLADKARVGQITLNIAGNALKYTPEGGSIDFRLKEIDCDREGYARFVLTVADTGIGMSEKYMQEMFKPFTRERSSTVSQIQGTGLGMSIVKRLVDLMGGKIDVKSELGKGTQFDVTLDFKIDDGVTEKQADVGDKLTEMASLKGKRILLVEDNELNREIAKDILEEFGLLVEEADDGDVAVEKVKAVADRGEYDYYDLVLMDIQMPKMNGYEATKAIRAIPDPTGAHLPIIALTANAFAEDRKNAATVGMDGHLAKPIEIDKLLTMLAKFL